MTLLEEILVRTAIVKNKLAIAQGEAKLELCCSRELSGIGNARRECDRED